SFVAVEDARNGYIKLAAPKNSDEWEKDDWMEIALFKKSNGEYVVGVTNNACAETCAGSLEFLEYRGDRFVDVSDKIYPVTQQIKYAQYLRKKRPEQPAPGESVFGTLSELPRVGKTVKVKFTGENGKELTLFEMTWNGESFVSNEPLPAAKSSPAPSGETPAAEKSWSPFFAAFRRAVQKRDRAALTKMMAKNISYDCCDQWHSSGDFRLALFERLDLERGGWRDFDTELSETFIESRVDDVPVRYVGKVVFEYRAAEKRWLCTSYVAAETP
ncbi:MAG TPA: hypothetical protein VGB00_19190, partial [Pyrinomonadaceae bacterium]